MIKMIASDLDGTLLLNKAQSLPEEIFPLIRKLKEMGILNMNACIASPAAESGHLTDDSYRFHKKMGFTLVGRFHNSGYKFGEWYDMIWMEKMIGEHEKDMPDVRFGQ